MAEIWFVVCDKPAWSLQGDKKRVGLSLNVGRLNSGVTDALHLGAVLPAAVRGVEDHGYSLTFGIKVHSNLDMVCRPKSYPFIGIATYQTTFDW